MNDEAIKAACEALAWERRYRNRGAEAAATPKWFLPEIDELDPDFAEALDRHGPAAGTLLEIGAGSGSQAIRYAQRGFAVTATDVAETCLNAARDLASRSGVAVTFRNDDIAYTRLEPSFSVICDRGCFTILQPALRPRYVANVGKLLAADGLFLVKIDGQKPRLLNHFAGFAEIARERGDFGGGGGEPNPSIMALFRPTRA